MSPSGAEPGPEGKGRQGGIFKALKYYQFLRLGCFHHDAADDIGCFIISIRSITEVSVDLSHLQHIDRIGLFEEIGEGNVIGLLHGIFIKFGFDGMLHGNIGIRFQDFYRVIDFASCFSQDVYHLLEMFFWGACEQFYGV